MINGPRLLIAVACSLLSVNCDESCPPGYVFASHACIAEAGGATSSTGGTGSQSDGGAPSEDSGLSNDAGDTSVPTCKDSTFGNTCMTAADCGCDTGFCAGYPGQQGICSHTGCLQDASVCPANWTCQDFSAFQAGLSVCTPA